MDRRYQAYYTKSDPISDYMVNMLDLTSTDTVFEPCGGDGVFVDKILSMNRNQKILIYEMDPNAVNILKGKYSKCKNVLVKETDTLLDSSVLQHRLRVQKIIGNPPYGATFNDDIKKKLRKYYSAIYSKESYTLFLYTCIQSLCNGGRLSFIVPDTFLSLHRHKKLRELMLTHTKIKELLLFPSSFFPGVNFGYANLCIITLERSTETMLNLANTFVVYNNFVTVDDINKPKGGGIMLRQGDVLRNIDSNFIITGNSAVSDLINGKNALKVGDIAKCVTGFYSGNDKAYLHPLSAEIKNAKRYTLVSQDAIHKGVLSETEKESGIIGNDCMVPIVKGGNKRYLKPNEWFMDWSKQAVTEYRKSKKCRFQNSAFYFRQGIAIPMIRSKQLTASLINYRLFDQSIVGVFPNDEKWLLYLLGFFNSEACSHTINLINPSTNNSANYIKQIPLIEPTAEQFDKVTEIVRKITDGGQAYEAKQNELNDIFNKIYNL